MQRPAAFGRVAALLTSGGVRQIYDAVPLFMLPVLQSTLSRWAAGACGMSTATASTEMHEQQQCAPPLSSAADTQQEDSQTSATQLSHPAGRWQSAFAAGAAGHQQPLNWQHQQQQPPAPYAADVPPQRHSRMRRPAPGAQQQQQQQQQQQGALMPPTAARLQQSFGRDSLSLAIMGSSSLQQLQELLQQPPSAWQPKQAALALARLPHLLPTPGSSSVAQAAAPSTLSAVGRSHTSSKHQTLYPSAHNPAANSTVRDLMEQLLLHLAPGTHLVPTQQPLQQDHQQQHHRHQQQQQVQALQLPVEQLVDVMKAAASLSLTAPWFWQASVQGLVQAQPPPSAATIVDALAALAHVKRHAVGLKPDWIHPQQVQALLGVCSKQQQWLQPSAIAWLLWQLQHLGLPVQGPTLQVYLDLLRRQLPLAKSHHITMSLYAVAKLQHRPPPEQVQQLLQALIVKLPSGSQACHDVTQGLWAAAKLQVPVPPQLLRPLLQELLQARHMASATTISQCLWAQARLRKLQLLDLNQLPVGAVQQLLSQLAQQPQGAKPRHCANGLWGAAVLQQEVEPATLAALVKTFTSRIHLSNTQEVANMVWASAILYSSCLGQRPAAVPQGAADVGASSPASDADQQQQEQGEYQQLPDQQQLWRLDTTEWPSHHQDVFLTPMQQAVLPTLQEALRSWLNFLAQHAQHAAAQELSIALWSGYYLDRTPLPAEVMAPMLSALARRVQQGRYAMVDVANALWASAQYRWYPDPLLSSWRRAAQDLGRADPREMSVVANALARLGYGDASIMGVLVERAQQLVTKAQGCHSRPIRQLASQVAWACAVLDQGQLAQQLQPLAAGCFAAGVQMPPQELVMWRQVHTWLLDQGHWETAGLQQVLTQQQMAACEAAWRDQARVIQDNGTSQLQRDVYRVLQKLGRLVLPDLAVQGMEQVEAQDGFVIIDIVASYKGHTLAIEVDGPRHWLRPDGRPSGPTLQRNRALAARGYTVVVIRGSEWLELKLVKDKLRYLMKALQAATREKPPDKAWEACGKWQQLRAAQASG